LAEREKQMSHAPVYEGTLGEIIDRYGKELNGHRLKVTLADDTDEEEVADRPFYETATAEEWSQALREWTNLFDQTIAPLSDEAISRESIYEGRGL